MLLVLDIDLGMNARISFHGKKPLDLESCQIASARLMLKPITQQYAQAVFSEFTADVTRYMFPKPAERIAETEEFIRKSEEARAAQADLVLVIVDRFSEEFLGCVGLHMRNDNPREPELGVWTKKSAQGQGYGREAIQALHRWASENLQVDFFVYPVDRANVSSRKIAEFLGGVFVQEKKVPTMHGSVMDSLEYQIPISAE
jgi:ribosomal-protein-alanine N-acetyltransferase